MIREKFLVAANISHFDSVTLETKSIYLYVIVVGAIA